MAWIRLIRRPGSAQSSFGQRPSEFSCWLQTAQASGPIASKLRRAHTTQMTAGPVRTYGHRPHWGKPGGGPAGSKTDGAMASQQRQREVLVLVLARPAPDPLGAGQVRQHLVGVADGDGAVPFHVAARPVLPG